MSGVDKVVAFKDARQSKREAWQKHAGDLSTAIGQIEAVRRMTRVWRAGLTANELSILLFIFDQTIGLGPDYADRPLTSAFIGEGNEHTCGLGLERWQIGNLIKSMKAKGVLSTRAHENTAFGTIFTINFSWEPPMLAVPKRLQGGKTGSPCVKNHAGGVGEITQGVCDKPNINKVTNKAYHLKEERNSPSGLVPGGSEVFSESLSPESETSSPEENKNSTGFAPGKILPVARVRTRPGMQPASPAPKCPAVTAETVVETVKAASAAKAAQARSSLHTEALKKTWDAACVEASRIRREDGEARIRNRGWTKEHHLKFRAAIVKFWRDPVEDLHAFVEWSVLKWNYAVGAQLSWMTRTPPPSTPDIGFFVAQWRSFHLAWTREDQRDYVNKLPNELQRRYHRARDAGKSHDEAMEELGRIKARSELHEQMEKREREANLKLRAAVEAANSAKRMVRAASTPHPKSEIALAEKRRLRGLADEADPLTEEELGFKLQPVSFTIEPFRE